MTQPIAIPAETISRVRSLKSNEGWVWYQRHMSERIRELLKAILEGNPGADISSEKHEYQILKYWANMPDEKIGEAKKQLEAAQKQQGQGPVANQT